MLSISESLAQEINKIKELTESGACIVVEGKRDEEAMRDFGVHTTFYHVSGSGKPLYKLAEELSMETEVIILTDFDRKGGILASKIVELLHKTAQKTRVNLEMRRNLMNGMKKAKVGEVLDLKALVHITHIKGDGY